MKKYTKVLALALALTMLLSMSVFAEGVGYTVTATGGSGAAISEATTESFKLTANADNGAMYLLLVLDDGFDPEGTEPLSASHIMYVNQATASGEKVTFDKVYPNKIADSKIYLAGGSLGGLTEIALLDAEDPEYQLGDVNGDGSVDILDYQRLYAHLDNSNALGENLSRGDVNENSEVDILDLQRLYAHLDGSNLLK